MFITYYILSLVFVATFFIIMDLILESDMDVSIKFGYFYGTLAYTVANAQPFFVVSAIILRLNKLNNDFKKNFNVDENLKSIKLVVNEDFLSHIINRYSLIYLEVFAIVKEFSKFYGFQVRSLNYDLLD